MPVSCACACACVSSAPPALSVLQSEDGACQAAERRPCGKATQALGGGRDDGDTAISPMLCAVRPYEGHRLQIPGCTTRECWAVSGLRLCGAMSDPAAMTARQMDTCTHTHTHPNTHTWTDQDHGKQAGREERRTGHWGQDSRGLAPRWGYLPPVTASPGRWFFWCPVPALVPLVVSALCNVGASAGKRQRTILLGPSSRVSSALLPPLQCLLCGSSRLGGWLTE